NKMDDIHYPVYERLKRAARNEELVFYGEIADIVGLNMNLDKDRGELGRILGAISLWEHQQSRPMLSVVAVLKNENTPSQGFFDWARQLGKLEGNTDMEELMFFATELRAAYDYWKDH